MSKLSKSHMPGWVSHGPVTVTVKGDLHIHEAQQQRASLPEVVVYGSGRLAAGLVEMTVGTLYALGVMLFSVLALSIWTLGRVGNVLLLIEQKAGGSRKQLVYAPAFLRRDIEQPKQLESDYDDN